MDILFVSSSAWALTFFSKQKLISILFPSHWAPESQNHLNHLISLLLKLGCLVELPGKLEKWLVFGFYLQRFWCIGYCASVCVLRGKGSAEPILPVLFSITLEILSAFWYVFSLYLPYLFSCPLCFSCPESKWILPFSHRENLEGCVHIWPSFFDISILIWLLNWSLKGKQLRYKYF